MNIPSMLPFCCGDRYLDAGLLANLAENRISFRTVPSFVMPLSADSHTPYSVCTKSATTLWLEQNSDLPGDFQELG